MRTDGLLKKRALYKRAKNEKKTQYFCNNLQIKEQFYLKWQSEEIQWTLQLGEVCLCQPKSSSGRSHEA